MKSNYRDMPNRHDDCRDAVYQGEAEPCDRSIKAVKPYRWHVHKKVSAGSTPIGEKPVAVDLILFRRWQQTLTGTTEAVQATAAMLAHSRVFHWS